MADPIFESLRRCLRQTQAWLDRYYSNAGGREAELRDKLARYVKHCWRTPRKWTDTREARRSIDKIKRASTVLAMLEYE